MKKVETQIADALLTPPVRGIMTCMAQGGGEARVVGGAVRDALMGRIVHDIDLATSLPPERVSALLGACGIKIVPTGIAFGTVTAVIDRKGYEITTLRHDLEADGRHAKVAFTDNWEADAARRDFTINALYLDAHGNLYDYFDGLEDLKQPIIRFIGDPKERIQEDVLRILRAYRFLAQLDGRASIDPLSLQACGCLARLLPKLSAERVWHELSALFAAEKPCNALALMVQDCVLSSILPGPLDLPRLQALVRIERQHGIKPQAVRRLAALVLPPAEGLAKRLRLSKAEGMRLAYLLKEKAEGKPICTETALRQRLYDDGGEAVLDALLLRAAVESVPLEAYLPMITGWQRPQFPLSGKDLSALGIKAGPEMGRILAIVENWWRAQNFAADKAACLEQAQKSL